MNEAEIAWAAGLFEGEGCVSVFPTGSGRSGVHLILQSTDHDVLERFQEVVGVGTIYMVNSDRPSRKPSNKQVWRWCVSRAPDSLAVLLAFRPWLGARRGARADEAIEVARSIRPRRSSKEVRAEGAAA